MTDALAVSYPLPASGRQTRNSRTELIYQIPGLPPLVTRNVEGLPQVRPGQNIPLTNEEWFDWVPGVLRHCAHARMRGETPSSRRDAYRAEECRLVAADERYWINTYAAIFESRVEEDSAEMESEEATDVIGAAGLSPFILYPFQDYWVTFHRNQLMTRGARGDSITLKSRDMGASNTMVATMDWRWMTRKVYHARLLSRNEDLVDATGDPDALFWKADQMLRTTPRYMLEHFAPGFNWQVHRRAMTLENPIRFNLIKGESTNATAGRGKRAFEIGLDEFTVMPGLKGIWTATRPSAPHRTAVGTVSTLKGLDAYNLVKRGGPAIIELDSRTGMHPRQDAAWHAFERERDTEAGYAQEVGMDWFADSSDFVYPEAHKKQVGAFPYLPFAGPVFVGIDDGTHWAMWWIQYIKQSGRFHVIEAYRNSGKRIAFYGGLMRGLALGDFSYGEAEQRILKLAREVPISHFVGDTHGAHREQIAGMSVYEDLALNWGITVNIDYMENQYVDRKKKTEDLIPLMDFNDTPGVTEGLQALKMYRFRATPEGREVAREVREPLHNDDSHYATAMERFCTQFDQFKWVYAGSQIVYQGEYST
jgi:hypothetical protein